MLFQYAMFAELMTAYGNDAPLECTGLKADLGQYKGRFIMNYI